MRSSVINTILQHKSKAIPNPATKNDDESEANTKYIVVENDKRQIDKLCKNNLGEAL